MKNTQEELYRRYMSFNELMLEENKPLEVAAIMAVQALSIYRTFLSEEDYLKMVESIYNNRFDVKKIEGPIIQ